MIGMAGEHDLVIGFGPLASNHPDMVAETKHLFHRSTGADLHAEAHQVLCQPVYIFAAASLHGPPLMLSRHSQECMVSEEPHQGFGRKFADAAGSG